MPSHLDDPDDADQGRHWSRQADGYDDLFLDPFRPGVVNPLIPALEAVPDPGAKTVADLGCGIGPLLPFLAGRFGRVFALDFAPGMLERAAERAARAGVAPGRLTFLARPMHALDDLRGELDVAVAVNSLVMPDVREIDASLRAIRGALKPDGLLLGVVPAMDAIHYHTMLLMDRALDDGHPPEESERLAAFHAEHHEYDFAFGRFAYRGLRQKFWQPFELDHRLAKAGLTLDRRERVLYPWDDSLPEGPSFAGQPPSWDWFFAARPIRDAGHP